MLALHDAFHLARRPDRRKQGCTRIYTGRRDEYLISYWFSTRIVPDYGAKQVKQADLRNCTGIVGNLAKGEDTHAEALRHRELDAERFCHRQGPGSCRGRVTTGILGILEPKELKAL